MAPLPVYDRFSKILFILFFSVCEINWKTVTNVVFELRAPVIIYRVGKCNNLQEKLTWESSYGPTIAIFVDPLQSRFSLQFYTIYSKAILSLGCLLYDASTNIKNKQSWFLYISVNN